jgi:hypothetical protein
VKGREMSRKPTLKEVDDHNATHLPFRSWCPICVAARAKNYSHKDREYTEGSKEVHYDYCFLRNNKGGDVAPVLVSKSRPHKLISAHVVPNKGASTEWIIKQSVKDIEKSGFHKEVVLRSDGEPAILDVMDTIAKTRMGETNLEHTAAGESQANGFIERGIQSLEEMVRTFKLDLEQRINTRVEVSWTIFEWLVEFAADVINKFVIGSDGRTAYERVKGKKHHGEFVRFCSYVMYRVAGKVEGGLMTERWMPGLWLGKRFHTDEHIVMNFDSGKYFVRAAYG